MSFQLENRRAVGKQVRKVVEKRLQRAIKALQARPLKRKAGDESVHTARKRLKEVRALLRLVRDDLGAKRFSHENRALRNGARPLSEVRDASALIGAFRSLQNDYAGEVGVSTFQEVRKALLADRSRIRRRVLKRDRALGKAASAVKRIQGRCRVTDWQLRHSSWKAVLSGLRRTYKQCVKTKRIALEESSDENLHEWRKRTKDLRYQLELLRPLWPEAMTTTAQQAKKLTELLGDDHDLAVLRGLLAHKLLAHKLKDITGAKTTATLTALIDRRRKDLQKQAKSLGAKLFAESAEQFIGRVKTYWTAAAVLKPSMR